MAALGTRLLKATIDGEERSGELTSCVIARVDPEDGVTTFANAAAGGGDEWELRGEALQDPGDADSLWNVIWEQGGAILEDTVVNPYGNTTASATEPHFVGDLIVSIRGSEEFLGGTANRSSAARFLFSFVFKYVAKPTKVVA